MSQQSFDLELVKQVQNGNKKAFDVLVLKYQSKLGKLISRYISDPNEVLDVTQETFIKAYRALPKFRGDSSFYTWLYRIAVNTAKNHLILKERRPPSTDIDISTAEQSHEQGNLREYNSPEGLLIREEIERAVADAMDNLPEELRTAITLRELAGLSYEEIAKVMNCPLGTVRSRIFRAREIIDNKIKPLLK